MDDNRKIISERNFTVSLLENLKTFLARLFSDFGRIIKSSTWKVRVENQVIIPEQIDTRSELQNILSAIQNMPEKDMPEKYDDATMVEAIKCVETAVKSIPEGKEADMSGIESKLSELIKLLTPAPMPKITKSMAEKSAPVFIGEEVVKDLKGNIIEVVEKWSDRDIASVKKTYTEDGLIKTMWAEEIRSK